MLIIISRNTLFRPTTIDIEYITVIPRYVPCLTGEEENERYIEGHAISKE